MLSGAVLASSLSLRLWRCLGMAPVLEVVEAVEEVVVAGFAGAEDPDGVGVGEPALADGVAWEGLEELVDRPWTLADFWPDPRCCATSILSSSSLVRI